MRSGVAQGLPGGGALTTHLCTPLPHLGLPVATLAAALCHLHPRDLRVTVVFGFPRGTGFVQIRRIFSGTHLVSDLIQFDVDPVTLTVGACFHLLLRLEWCLRRSVTLAHRATSLWVYVAPPPAITIVAATTPVNGTFVPFGAGADQLLSRLEILAFNAAIRSANHG